MTDYYEEHYTLDKSSYLDLKVLDCGIQKCKPLHFFGPYVRSFYLIHYILNGKGIFRCNDKEYNLSQGQMFFIFPNKVTFYQADQFEPWHYCWFSFTGLKLHEYCRCAGVDIDNPIADEPSINNDFIMSLYESKESPAKLTGLSHILFDKLKKLEFTSEGDFRSSYTERAINYINLNYWREIKVQELADYCILDRSYFSRIFKEITGQSPQSFIISFKMAKAKELLLQKKLSVGDVSRSVGYEDPLYFSKVFKKVYGITPSGLSF